jgi:hypothetical protein
MLMWRQSGWFCYPAAGLETAAAPRRVRVALSIPGGVPSNLRIVLARIPQASESQVAGGRCMSAPLAARGLASEAREGPGSPASARDSKGTRFGGGGWRLHTEPYY